eukprot:GHUV01045693.1.p1 GENE.GHUV01045693.1~~GHUV01045693.1.p1  ORF type:complete len:388 (+),score=54.49 GHUV01045693.1:180-1343(+)
MAESARQSALKARNASRKLQALPTEERVAMLHRIADALVANEESIMAENSKVGQLGIRTCASRALLLPTFVNSSSASDWGHLLQESLYTIASLHMQDVEEAKGNISESLLQRLILKPQKIKQLADGIRAIAAEEEPIRRVLSRTEVAEGLVLEKQTAPIGVLLIIFEARPDALPQIAALALRSGNGLLLKGGKEASRSNAILHKTITDAIGSNLGPDLIHLITSRDEISDLLKLDDVIDLVIPRGGNALVSHIQQNTKIPVLGHADGICHVYVDQAADLDQAIEIVVDSKADYPAACNAVEKVLVHETLVGSGGLTKIQEALQEAGVQVRIHSLADRTEISLRQLLMFVCMWCFSVRNYQTSLSDAQYITHRQLRRPEDQRGQVHAS